MSKTIDKLITLAIEKCRKLNAMNTSTVEYRKANEQANNVLDDLEKFGFSVKKIGPNDFIVVENTPYWQRDGAKRSERQYWEQGTR